MGVSHLERKLEDRNTVIVNYPNAKLSKAKTFP